METKRWLCTVCKQSFDGDAPPAPCPVCGAGESAFVDTRRTVAKWRCTVCSQIFEGVTPPDPCPVCGAGESAFERVDEGTTAFRRDTKELFVVIGGGIAGLSAAEAIRERNATASVTLICGEGVFPYNRPALSDVVADGLSLLAVTLHGLDYYEEKRIDVVTGARAVAIDRQAGTVSLGDTSVPYDKLALCVGATPFNPVKSDGTDIPVYTLRTYFDAVKLTAEGKPGRRAVVVGGGILGVEAAVALRERGVKVTVVEFAPRIVAAQADDYAAAYIKERLIAAGIDVITQAAVAQVLPTGVALSTGQTVEADFCLVSAGVRSDLALAQGCGLEVDRGIVVDDSMATSDPRIFAAGDCAQHNGRVTGLWASSMEQGRVCGASMAGEEVRYAPVVPATAFNAVGVNLFSAGNVNPSRAKTVTVNDENGTYRRLYFENGRLTGVVFLGDVSGAATALRLIGATPDQAGPLL